MAISVVCINAAMLCVQIMEYVLSIAAIARAWSSYLGTLVGKVRL